MNAHIAACENYLLARTGCYEWRSLRYACALDAMAPLGDDDMVVDVGAGWTEFDYYLRRQGWIGRYWPVDGMLDGTDLNTWVPPREAEFFVALEILEHLHNPERLIAEMQRKARRGVIVSVPNPRTTDVLGMDPTHVTVVEPALLRDYAFNVYERSFYGQPHDSLFGVWRRA